MSGFYGLIEQRHALDIARAVCDVLGHGQNERAVHLLLETAAQETHLGRFRDRTDYGAGVGLCQVDPIGFEDVQVRTRGHHKQFLREAFDIDLDRVQHRELEHSPLLSMIVCRLHYKLRPELIPVTLAGRSLYWKRYYNTAAGKGTASEYIHNAQRYAEPLMGRSHA